MNAVLHFTQEGVVHLIPASGKQEQLVKGQITMKSANGRATAICRTPGTCLG